MGAAKMLTFDVGVQSKMCAENSLTGRLTHELTGPARGIRKRDFRSPDASYL